MSRHLQNPHPDGVVVDHHQELQDHQRLDQNLVKQTDPDLLLRI